MERVEVGGRAGAARLAAPTVGPASRAGPERRATVVWPVVFKRAPSRYKPAALASASHFHKRRLSGCTCLRCGLVSNWPLGKSVISRSSSCFERRAVGPASRAGPGASRDCNSSVDLRVERVGSQWPLPVPLGSRHLLSGCPQQRIHRRADIRLLHQRFTHQHRPDARLLQFQHIGVGFDAALADQQAIGRNA